MSVSVEGEYHQQLPFLIVILTVIIQGKSLQEMKMSIGEQLYYSIHTEFPDTAGKLTGMFLEATDSVEDLALLLFSPASLKLLLGQAFDVLSVIIQSTCSCVYLFNRALCQAAQHPEEVVEVHSPSGEAKSSRTTSSDSVSSSPEVLSRQ